MFESAIKILSLLEKKGYKSYIVGGYVRDYYLNIKSTDIDICTSATINDLINIFSDYKVFKKYNAIKVVFEGYKYDITSFRRDFYLFNRLFTFHTKSLKKDVFRRDFYINSMYMDKNKNIIDILNAKEDFNNKIVRTIGDSNKRIKEDPIRILRAIKYSLKLDFSLDDNLKNSIINNKEYLRSVSYNRKKEELNEIFKYKNCFKILNELDLNNYLDYNVTNIKWCNDYLGIWAQLNFSNNYMFTKEEQEKIDVIRSIMNNKTIDKYTVYKYGVNICLISSEILNISKKEIKNIYNNLQIHKKSDICITYNELSSLLSIKSLSKINKIYEDIEKNIVYDKIINEKKEIIKYIKKEYNYED